MSWFCVKRTIYHKTWLRAAKNVNGFTYTAYASIVICSNVIFSCNFNSLCALYRAFLRNSFLFSSKSFVYSANQMEEISIILEKWAKKWSKLTKSTQPAIGRAKSGCKSQMHAFSTMIIEIVENKSNKRIDSQTPAIQFQTTKTNKLKKQLALLIHTSRQKVASFHSILVMYHHFMFFIRERERRNRVTLTWFDMH